MTAAVQWIDPGPVGFVAGAVLIVCAVALVWLLLSGRRADAEQAVEVPPAPPGRPLRHPSQGPQRRVDDATQLIARRSDDPDATMVHPRVPQQRAATR